MKQLKCSDITELSIYVNIFVKLFSTFTIVMMMNLIQESMSNLVFVFNLVRYILKFLRFQRFAIDRHRSE